MFVYPVDKYLLCIGTGNTITNMIDVSPLKELIISREDIGKKKRLLIGED